MTWKEAIDKVLAQSREPLHYREITERIIEQGLRRTLGATPAATVNAQIASSIKHEGKRSPYVRVAKGVFALRSRLENELSDSVKTSEAVMVADEEEEKNVITAFGMFWRRENVEWKRMPKLLGMQQLGAEAVDFSSQIGVYLLYDGREVVYVGRSTDRPLGRRLYEHTVDRLSARWDRFSWFGLLPVDERGKIGELPESYSAQALIPMMEALLIEALEPRQNRRRGDDFEAVEYLQMIDPEIEKKRVKALIDRL
jgi:hypothetical protein